MGDLISHKPWIFACSLFASFISGIQYLTPLLTFYSVRHEGYWTDELITSVPYAISLLTCMLKIYHVLITGISEYQLVVLITNSIGIIFTTIHIIFYFFHAPRKAIIRMGLLIMLLDVVFFGMILLLTRLIPEDTKRMDIFGLIYVSCLTVSAAVSPSIIIWQVIKTKSIRCMPFYDPLLTALGSSAWLACAIFINNKDNIAVPNGTSLIFGIIQMVMYMVLYKNKGDDHMEDSIGVDSIQLPEDFAGAGVQADIQMVSINSDSLWVMIK